MARLAERAPQAKEGPGCTPTVDGQRLYVGGLGGNVACLQVEDGKILWQISMTDDFGGRVPMWSYRESPLVDGDRVICTPGGKDATLVALDKLTGSTIWKAQMPSQCRRRRRQFQRARCRSRRKRRQSSGPA